VGWGLGPHLGVERLERRPRQEAVGEDREHGPRPGRRGREEALEAELVRRVAHRLTGSARPGAELARPQPERRRRLRRAQVEHRHEADPQSMELPRDELLGGEALSGREPVELVGDRRDVEPEVERAEALWRIPPPAVDAGPDGRKGVAAE